jgi:hypothetical protein
MAGERACHPLGKPAYTGQTVRGPVVVRVNHFFMMMDKRPKIYQAFLKVKATTKICNFRGDEGGFQLL